MQAFFSFFHLFLLWFFYAHVERDLPNLSRERTNAGWLTESPDFSARQKIKLACFARRPITYVYPQDFVLLSHT